MAVRGRIVIGRTDNSGQIGILRQTQFAHVFSEVRHAGLGESANSEAAAIAQVHFVCVHFENLLLGEALLHLQRNEGFGKLATPVAIGGKEEGPRDLHGDGARALVMLAGVPDVGPGRADDSNEIESAVLEKALVFRRKNRVHQHDWQVFVPYRTPLFARAVKQVGDQLWLNFGGVYFRATLERPDAANAPSAELHGQRVLSRKIRQLRGPNVPRIRLYGVLSDGVGIGLRSVY